MFLRKLHNWFFLKKKQKKIRNQLYDLIKTCSIYTERVEVNRFYNLFEEYYDKELDYGCFGFETLEGFLTYMENDDYSVLEENNETFIVLEPAAGPSTRVFGPLPIIIDEKSKRKKKARRHTVKK